MIELLRNHWTPFEIACVKQTPRLVARDGNTAAIGDSVLRCTS